MNQLDDYYDGYNNHKNDKGDESQPSLDILINEEKKRILLEKILKIQMKCYLEYLNKY